MKFKCIHVGLGIFSLQRLQINLNNSNFEIVAFVDSDKEKSLERLKKLKNIQIMAEQYFVLFAKLILYCIIH